MRLILSRVLLALSLLLILTLTVLFLCVDSAPTVDPETKDSQGYLSATRNLLHSSINPTSTERQRVIGLTAEDLTAVANFALLRKNLTGHTQASIHQSHLDFRASIKLKSRWPSGYLNFQVLAEDAIPVAAIQKVKVGSIGLPRPIVRFLGYILLNTTALGRYLQVAAPMVQEVRIEEQRLRVVLNWNRGSLAQAQELVTDISSKERLLAYHNKLADLLSRPELKRYVNLGNLMQPLFTLAQTRSIGEAGDPVEENRALVLVIAAYVSGKSLLPALNGAIAPAKLATRGILLHRRIDMAQHFLASAALTISSNRTVADMVGLAKEINDTHSGSGFSFTDLAADRAGARFGKMVVHSALEAHKAQQVMSQSADEFVFMPSIRDLPENLGVEAFANRFKNIESSEFQEIKGQIETRIATCPLYR